MNFPKMYISKSKNLHKNKRWGIVKLKWFNICSAESNMCVMCEKTADLKNKKYILKCEICEVSRIKIRRVYGFYIYLWDHS